jgi:type IV pilus assembly protein PilF
LAFVFLFNGCAEHSDKVIEQQKSPQRTADAARINTQLGLAYLKQGNRSRAKSKLLNALSLAPKSPDVNAGFAYYLETSGDIENADQYYQKAISFAGNSGAQLNNYGAFLCRNKRYAEADKYFLKAVEDVKYLNVAGAYENAGLCAEANGNDSKALAYFKKALVQDPQRKPSLVEALQLLVKQHKDNSALDLLKQYPELTYQDSGLLKQGVMLAEKTHDENTLSFYQARLQSMTNIASSQSGDQNDNG